MASIRRPRFERAPIRSMRLTARDFEILLAVKRHRLLRSTHIAALVPGSRQGTLRRLHLLFHHGYLDRPPAQLNWYLRGSEPLVYALGNRGGRLPEVGGGSLRWDTKNSRLSRMHLAHALAVAEVMVGLELLCRRIPGARLIGAEEILAAAPKARRPKRLPIRWSVETRVVGELVRLGIEPDKVFGVRFGEGPGTREAFYFLEVDRGTMPVVRKDLGQTSIRRKLLAYEATWRQRAHQALLGIPDFRVLVVVPSAGRAASILGVGASLSNGGAKRILVASVAEALRDQWTDGRERPAKVLAPFKSAALKGSVGRRDTDCCSLRRRLPSGPFRPLLLLPAPSATRAKAVSVILPELLDWRYL